MAYNIFERWPFTSFQNLNLDWLLKTTKEAAAAAQEAAATVAQYAARLLNIENSDSQQNTKIAALESKGTQQDTKIAALESKDTQQDTKITALETSDAQQDTDIYNASEAALSAQSTANTAIQMANLIAENQMFTCVVNNSASPTTSSKNYAALYSILVTQKKSINFIYIDPYGYEYETALVVTSANKIRAIFILDRASSSDPYRVIYVDIMSDDSITISTDSISSSGGGGTVESGIFLITAVYSNGQYTFDRNQADILSAIQSGKLPVVRHHTTGGNASYHIYYEWVLDYYSYDGEDVYIYFSRVDQSGNSAQLRWTGSAGKAVEVSRPTLPPATGADEGKIPMVNSFGNYQLTAIPAAENTSFGT